MRRRRGRTQSLHRDRRRHRSRERARQWDHPEKRKARPVHQNALSLTQLSAPNNGANGAALQIRREREGERNRVFFVEDEAERLLREFWMTGSLSHLTAFCRHIVAMRRQLEGRGRERPDEAQATAQFTRRRADRRP